MDQATTNQRHVAVIDPAMRIPELDCYNQLSRAAQCWTSYHLPALHGFDSLHYLPQAPLAGVVILGSGASVYDGLPWQEPLNKWVHNEAVRGTPIMGLCYGHQLLAHIFGGTIGLLWEGKKAKGSRSVTVTDGLLSPQPTTGPLIVSHREGVIECPAGFDICAVSDEVLVDGIAHKDRPIWGFQPHIEATAGFLSNNEIEADDAAMAFDYGYSLLDAFFNFVRSRPLPAP